MEVNLSLASNQLHKIGLTETAKNFQNLADLANFLNDNKDREQFKRALVGKLLNHCIDASEGMPEIQREFLTLRMVHSSANNTAKDFVKCYNKLLKIDKNNTLSHEVILRLIVKCSHNTHYIIQDNQDFRDLCDLSLKRAFQTNAAKEDTAFVLYAKALSYNQGDANYVSLMQQSAKLQNYDAINDLYWFYNQALAQCEEDSENFQKISKRLNDLMTVAYDSEPEKYRSMYVKYLAESDDEELQDKSLKIVQENPEDLFAGLTLLSVLAFEALELNEDHLSLAKDVLYRVHDKIDFDPQLKDLAIITFGVISCDILIREEDKFRPVKLEELEIIETLDNFRGNKETNENYPLATYFIIEANYSANGTYLPEHVEEIRDYHEIKLGEFRSIVAGYDLEKMIAGDKFDQSQIQTIKDLQLDVLLGLISSPVRTLETVIKSQEYLTRHTSTQIEEDLLDTYRAMLGQIDNEYFFDENHTQRIEEIGLEAERHRQKYQVICIEQLRNHEDLPFGVDTF